VIITAVHAGRILSGMDGAQVLAAMDDNHAQHAVYGPGITVRDTGDLITGDSGLADDTFNIVARARFTRQNADLRIAQTIAGLRATGRPYSWWAGPTSTPADLSDRLRHAAGRARRLRHRGPAGLRRGTSGVRTARLPHGGRVRGTFGHVNEVVYQIIRLVTSDPSTADC
jgi:hypothetical protein